VRLGLTLGLTDAHYTRTVLTAGGQAIVDRDTAVGALPSVPSPWTGAFFVQYRQPLMADLNAYIAANDPALTALCAEPAAALIAGPTGLELLSAIIARAPAHLHAGGWLALEHGIAQAQDVAQLLQAHGFDSIRTYSDFSGRPRITLGVHTQH